MNFNNLVGSVVISRISMIFVFVFVEGHYVNYRATGLPINKIFVCLFVCKFLSKMEDFEFNTINLVPMAFSLT